VVTARSLEKGLNLTVFEPHIKKRAELEAQYHQLWKVAKAFHQFCSRTHLGETHFSDRRSQKPTQMLIENYPSHTIYPRSQEIQAL